MFRVGDEVIAINATYGWANVRPGDIGKVRRIVDSFTLRVDFPNHPSWSARPSDLIEASYPNNIAAAKALLCKHSQMETVVTDL